MVVGAGALFAFIIFRGPNIAVVLSNAFTQFTTATAFSYVGNAESDLMLTAVASDGVARNGAVKFTLDYAGQLMSTKEGYGDGNHQVKFTGGLQSGNYAWSTDITSDLRIVADELYFHVLSFPSVSNVDPELFKTYWIKVDIAEIAKELALQTAAENTADYGNLAGADKSTPFNAIISNTVPFTGGTKIGTEQINGVSALHIKLNTDNDKMFLLVTQLYQKYMGKALALTQDEQLRFKGALGHITTEVWVDQKTNALLKISFAAKFDDDIAGVHVKGPAAFTFAFSNYNAPIVATLPSPTLNLNDLHSRMDDYKRQKDTRARDALKINTLSDIEKALNEYKTQNGRYPTFLSDLRLKNMLSTTTMSDALLKSYTFASYVQPAIWAKSNRCNPKSKTCDAYHIGVNLESSDDPALQNDADVAASDMHGADDLGCASEKNFSCYDIVFPRSVVPIGQTVPPNATSSTQ
jgi:type II secretory pathway pseudopilin PulG